MAAAATKPKNLHEALLGVQRAAILLDLPKSKTNPHFKNKYTPLDVVLGQVIPLLNNNGFLLIQSPSTLVNGVTTRGDNTPTLTTRFIYTPTGEELTDHMLLMPGREDPQGQGAAITYARRYAIMSILGLTSDEDDDGNSSQRSHTRSSAPAPEESNNESGVEAAAASFDAPSGSPI